MRNKQEVNTMDSVTLTSAVLHKWNEDAHGGHAKEHRQEMIAIAKEVIKQYDFKSTIAKQTEKMIKEVFEKEMSRMFKKHGMKVTWK